MDKIKVGDWVRVFGEGCDAFQVEWINGDTVGVNGDAESLSKVTKLDLNKYGIHTFVHHMWYEK